MEQKVLLGNESDINHDNTAIDSGKDYSVEHNESVVDGFFDGLEIEDNDTHQHKGRNLNKHNLAPNNQDSLDDEREARKVIANFLNEFTCYDILPESSKVVIFDRNVPVRLSYYALVEHEIGAAPLWDPLSQTLSGIVTTLDFIEMLRYGYFTNSLIEILDNHSVASWRSLVVRLCESPEIAGSLMEAAMPAVSAASMAAEYEKALITRSSMYIDPMKLELNIHPEMLAF